MKIKPRNKRLLVILEGTENGKLAGITSKGGIHIPSISMSEDGLGTEATLGLQDRWAKVIACGPDCTEIQTGDRVCIYSQKWTPGFQWEDKEWYWFSDEDEVLMIDMLYRDSKGKEQTETELSSFHKKMKGMYD